MSNKTKITRNENMNENMNENEKNIGTELSDEALAQAAGGSFDDLFEDIADGYCPNGCRMYIKIGNKCPQCGAIAIGDPAGVHWRTKEAKEHVRYYPKN